MNNIIKNIDWITIFLYLLLISLGLTTIYSASYDENHPVFFDFSQKYGKQFVWIIASIVIGFLILLTDSKFLASFSIPIYILVMLSLIAVLFLGKETKGAKSWFELGNIAIQPAEFGKFATNLAVAFVMSRHGFKVMRPVSLCLLSFIILLPAVLIILQNDTGSALVYSSFILVLFREGLHGVVLIFGFIVILLFVTTLAYSQFTAILIIIIATDIAYFYYRNSLKEALYILIATGILYIIGYYATTIFPLNNVHDHQILIASYFILSIFGLYHIYKHKLKKIKWVILAGWFAVIISYSVNYAFDKLQPHQQKRINEVLNIEIDPLGTGYNVNQSKIAIGSGEFWGKGYLKGTQTKFNFVPEQSTDFIFCTVGEEWGFLGSFLLIALFACFIYRIIYMAERQRSDFSRIYGYGVACIIFFHLAVNIGMTIGLLPVIGIPLPFFSYGGSSLWAFTILIFIFIRLDANRLQIFR